MLRPIQAMLVVAVVLVLGEWTIAQDAPPRISFGALAVKPDGSADPPGDRLELTAILNSSDRAGITVDLEVRAYEVEGSDDQISERTRRPINHRRLQDSDVLAKESIPLPAGVLLHHDLIVPYANFDLAPGAHRVGYEITCRCEGQLQFVAASQLTIFVVSDKTRTSMPLKSFREVTISEPLAGNIVSEQAATWSQTEVAIERAVAEQAEKTVNIPGEFLRHEIATYGPENAMHLPAAPSQRRLVWFVTNRKRQDAVRPGDRFGTDIDSQVRYGSALVRIPVRHSRGNIETGSSWWRTRQDFFEVEALNTLEHQQFLEGISGPSQAADLLLFLHGYNVTFQESLLRAAQLAYDTNFVGPVLAFDWASAGSLSQYPEDRSRAKASTPALVDLLQALDARLPRNPRQVRLHVVAHSMGNRLLLQALSDQQPAPVSLGHLVLAAPDVSAQEFIACQDALAAAGQSRALFYSSRDKALIASHVRHGAPRIGEGPLHGARGLDNIDASKIDLSILAHSYYGDTSLMLVDLQLLLVKNLSPPDRATLKENIADRKYKYWYFP